MFNGPLMLWVNLTRVDAIHLKGNKFVMGVKTKATVDSKLNDNSAYININLSSK